MPQHKRINEVGNRYGKLVVIEQAPHRGKSVMWRCRCACGNETVVAGTEMRRSENPRISCGCARATFATTHGGTGTYLYEAWLQMMKRCRNPNHRYYKDYGGRGITVCDEWANSFAAFRDHVGERPTPKHSIDRINNDRGYEPGNVRWATQKEQIANRRPLKRRQKTPGSEGAPRERYSR